MGKFSIYRFPSTFLLSLFFFTSLPISHAGVSHLPLYFKINMKIGFLDAKMNIHTPINTHAVCGCGYVLCALASVRFLVPVGICCVDLHTVLYTYIIFLLFLSPPFVQYTLSAHLQLVSRIAPTVCGLAIER